MKQPRKTPNKASNGNSTAAPAASSTATSVTKNGGARRGIYFLPSVFTTAGLLFGFYAIIQVTQTVPDFDKAAKMLLIAMIMDGLDGRVARWTNTASDFGKEYDSLVDLIAFGLAPALMMYFWALQHLGTEGWMREIGWLSAFLYAAATALRLARFNTLQIKDKRYFYGIPCPAAAGFMVFWVWSFDAFGIVGQTILVAWGSALATLILAVLMVSNLRFRSFKDFNLSDRIPFAILIAVVITAMLIFFDPPRVLFLLACTYVASGPIGWLIRWKRGNPETPAFLPEHDEEQ